MNSRIMSVLICTSLASLTLSSQVLTEERTVEIPRDFTYQPFPRFQNGFAVAFDRDQPIVRAYDRSGKVVLTVPLSIPNASRTRVRDVAASPNGGLAVSGSAIGSADVGSAFIVWISPSGAVERVVRTSPFGAVRLAFAPDGTLWAAGGIYGVGSSGLAEYDIIRQYDTEGRLVRTALPRAMFAPTVPNPAGESFLAANRDRIGFYSARANAYAELSPSGDILGVWPAAPLQPRTVITGIALTPSATVFLSAGRLRKSGEPARAWELPIYRLDKSSRALVQLPQGALPTPNGPMRPTLLLGSDGDELVFYGKPPASLWWFMARQ